MKKIKCILLILLFFFIFSTNINAEIIESPEINQSSEYMCEGKSFNLMKGIDNAEDILDSYYYFHIYENITGYIVNGEVHVFGEITSDSYSFELIAVVGFEDSNWISYDIYLEDELIYSVSFNDGNPTVNLSKEINLYQLYKEVFTFTLTEDIYYDQGIELNPDCDPNSMVGDFLEVYTFKAIYIMEYRVNEGYEEDDVIRFVVDSNNPLSSSEILDSIIIEDETDGEIVDYEILQNDYVVTDNYIEEGDYTLEVLTRDYAGNTTVLSAVVSAYDITPPTITATDCSYSYVFLYSWDSLKKKFTVEEGATLEIIEDNYTPNYNKLGTYTVVGQATDSAGNTATATLYVTVIDDRAPIITVNKNECISTLDDYNLQDFVKFVSAYDSGEDRYTDCVVETDLNDYMNNKRKAGYYRFYITSTDEAGNKGEGYLTIRVVDSDYPLIKADEYTFIVKEDYQITKEEIIEILKNRGQITENVNIELTSSYFEEESPNGTYLLEVTDSEGNKYTNSIEIFEVENNFDYSTKPDEEVKQDYSSYYIIGGVSAALIVVIGVLAVIKSKKRH